MNWKQNNRDKHLQDMKKILYFKENQFEPKYFIIKFKNA